MPTDIIRVFIRRRIGGRGRSADHIQNFISIDLGLRLRDN